MPTKPAALRRSWIVKVFAVWLVWLLLILSARTIAISEIHQPQGQHNPVANASFFLQAGVKWDGLYYLNIATHGYGTAKGGLEAFFPGFPYSTRLLGQALGVGPIAAGFMLNALAALAAMAFLYLIAKEYLKRDSVAMTTMLLFAFSPFSYFMLAYYSEAMFCALSFGAFYFALKRRWLYAGLLLMLLTSVRLVGVLVAFAVLVEYASSIEWQIKKVRPQVLWLGLAPLGLLSYMLLLSRHFGDPLMFLHAYKYGWGYQVFNPNFVYNVVTHIGGVVKQVIHYPVGWKDDWFQSLATSFYELLSWLLGFAALVWGFRKKLPVSWLVYIGTSLVIFSINSNLVSVNRYILPLFPMYILMADWLDRREVWMTSILLASSAVAMGLFLTLFSNGFWTG